MRGELVDQALLTRVGVRSARLRLVDRLDVHVEVAYFAQYAAEPAQLAAEALKVGRQGVVKRANHGTQASDCHAHVMDGVDALAQAGARLVAQELAELHPQ